MPDRTAQSNGACREARSSKLFRKAAQGGCAGDWARGKGGDGRIAIYCEYLETDKDGNISPKPFVNNEDYKYDEDNFEFTAINTYHDEKGSAE